MSTKDRQTFHDFLTVAAVVAGLVFGAVVWDFMTPPEVEAQAGYVGHKAVKVGGGSGLTGLTIEETGKLITDGDVGIGGGSATTPDTSLHLELDDDTSVTWWTSGKSSVYVENVHASGDAILKLGGVDSRIVFGPNDAAALLKISSRHSAGDTAEDIVVDNNGAMTVPDLTVEDDLLVSDDATIAGVLDFTGAPNTAISSGSATPTATFQSLSGEGGVADDCDTLVAAATGQFVIIKPLDSTNTVTMKDGTGNMRLAGDFALDHVFDTITLVYDGTGWLEVSRSNNQ